MPTQCQLCGEVDGPDHIASHVEADPKAGDPEGLVVFLTQLAQTATRRNPHVPIPCQKETSREIVLDTDYMWDNTSCDTLSVDLDEQCLSSPLE